MRHFLNWVATAKMAERAAAAAALARAYIRGDLSFDDRVAAEAALTLLLDDLSADVRLALSETLSPSRHAPAPEVAGRWRLRSYALATALRRRFHRLDGNRRFRFWRPRAAGLGGDLGLSRKERAL